MTTITTLELNERDVSHCSRTQLLALKNKNHHTLLQYLCGKPINEVKINFDHPLAIVIVSRLSNTSINALARELGVDPKPFYQALNRFKGDESTKLSKVLSERLELFIRRRGFPLHIFDLKHLPLSKAMMENGFGKRLFAEGKTPHPHQRGGGSKTRGSV